MCIRDRIGALPDNSVGDTLERITGVTADRFKGNANELSVRGLGPTLSFSTFNGREVSTAGPDRSVAFQQFPSELVNGVLVYKTQQADFAEGGIAGVIDLRSIRLIGAIELEPIAGLPTKRAFSAFLKAYDAGLLIRTTGDIIALSPPLIIEKSQIDFIFDTLKDILTSLD